MSERCIIYALSDPRKPAVIKYIGKTHQSLVRRLAGHMSQTECEERSYRANWLRSLKRLGLTPRIWPLEICGSDWEEKEKYWIRLFKPMGLTNRTDGGEGAPGNKGWKWSTEALARISSIRKGKCSPAQLKHIQELHERAKGGKRSPEAIEKTRAKVKGRKMLPEQIENLRRSKLGKKYTITPERRLALQENARRYLKWPPGSKRPIKSAETRLKLSLAQKGKLRPHVTMAGGKAVECIETGEQFVSIWRAVQAKGIAANRIRRSFTHGIATKGLHWKLVGYPAPTLASKTNTLKVLQQCNLARRKEVICVETGEVYPSIRAAAEALNKNVAAFCENLRHGWKTRGKTFRVKEALCPVP